ncbi:MAG: Lrp/AsnC family transcriptional regulator [Emcibacter sp.]|nr:Lrp/AsnC family transcriptional regulator [Emcibacter sp.]
MTKKRTIDRIDLKILSILQNNARITNHDLSSEVNLSPSSCLQRVRRLEEEGYLESYMAVINLNKICRTVTVLLTVSLHDHTNTNFKTFESVINDFPEIVECYTVSGNFDYFLRIVCPDMDRYLELNDKLIECMEGVANISSHVALATTKSFKGYALDLLVD